MEEQNNNEEAFIYNVKVDNQEKKAIDLVFLKNFIEGIKTEYSVLSLDPSSIDKDDTMHMFLSKAAIETLSRVEYIVNLALGLVEEPVQEPVQESKSKPSVASEEVIDVDKEIEQDSEAEVVEPKPEGDKIVL